MSAEWIRRLQAWHEANRPELLAELAPPAKPGDLAKVAKRVGAELPDVLVALWRWHDGRREDCYSGLQHNRQLMSIAEALDTMNTMDELLDAGEFEQPHWWNKRWLPFLANGGGDNICIDFAGSFGGKPGQVIEFWHDDEDRTIVYPDVATWLHCFVETLEAGLWEDQEGDLHPKSDHKYEKHLAKLNPGYPKGFDADGKPQR